MIKKFINVLRRNLLGYICFRRSLHRKQLKNRRVCFCSTLFRNHLKNLTYLRRHFLIIFNIFVFRRFGLLHCAFFSLILSLTLHRSVTPPYLILTYFMRPITSFIAL